MRNFVDLIKSFLWHFVPFELRIKIADKNMNKYSALGWKKTDKSKVGSEVRCFQAYCGCVGGLRKILRKGGDHIVHTGNKEWARNWLAPPKPEEKSCKTL